MYHVFIRETFSSAHSLRGYHGNCAELHGHNWIVEVHAAAENVDHLGLAMDFAELKAYTREVLARLDHKHLNDIPPFDEVNPTAELLARYIYEELDQNIETHGVELSKVTIWENSNCGVSYLPAPKGK